MSAILKVSLGEGISVGSLWYAGADTVPPVNLGKTGDFYLATLSPRAVFKKEAQAWVFVAELDGVDGKSAYDYAVLGGYSGSTEDFTRDMAQAGDMLAHISDEALHVSEGDRVRWNAADCSLRPAAVVVGHVNGGASASETDFLCDGTNDHLVIGAAIDALPASGGKVLFLDGTYTFGERVTVAKAGVTLAGSGAGTVFLRGYNGTATDGMLTVTAKNVTVSCIQFDGNAEFFAYWGNVSLYLNGAVGARVADCSLVNAVSTALTGANLNDCTIERCDFRGKVDGDGHACYLRTASGSVKVVGNSFSGFFRSGNAGIRIVGDEDYSGTMAGSDSKNRRYLIAANTFVNCYSAINVSDTSNVTIASNAATFCNTGIELYYVGKFSIVGNTISGGTLSGMMINGGSANASITGNTIMDMGLCGIRFSGGNFTVSGNMVIGCGTAGIQLDGAVRSNITGNTVLRGTGLPADYTATQYTINLYGTSNNNNLISNNQIFGKNYVAAGGTGNTFANNKYN